MHSESRGLALQQESQNRNTQLHRDELSLKDAELPLAHELFEASTPIEFKKKLRNYFEINKNNIQALEELANIIYELDNRIKSEENGNNPEKMGKRAEGSPLGSIKESYLAKSFNKKKILFLDYLREFLKERAKFVDDKYVIYKQLQAQRAEKQREIIESQEREKEIAEMIPRIKQEMIDEMDSRTNLSSTRAPEHQRQINDFERDRNYREAHASKEDREMRETVREQELLLGFIMEKEGLFGDDARISHTDKYDDYFNHVDLVVETERVAPLFIDISYNLEKAGNKLYFNRQNSYKELDYPTNESLKNKAGIPVVAGMSKEDAENAINSYLRESAIERIEHASGEADTEELGRSMSRFIEYILLQLQYQYDYIYKFLESAPKQQIEDYEEALEEYEKTIEYFKKIKKGRPDQVKLDESRQWDKIMLDLDFSVVAYERRQGLEEAPPPNLEHKSA